MSMGRYVRRERTRAKTGTLTFNASGSWPIPYGKAHIVVSGKGQDGQAASNGNYAYDNGYYVEGGPTPPTYVPGNGGNLVLVPGNPASPGNTYYVQGSPAPPNYVPGNPTPATLVPGGATPPYYQPGNPTPPYVEPGNPTPPYVEPGNPTPAYSYISIEEYFYDNQSPTNDGTDHYESTAYFTGSSCPTHQGNIKIGRYYSCTPVTENNPPNPGTTYPNNPNPGTTYPNNPNPGTTTNNPPNNPYYTANPPNAGYYELAYNSPYYATNPSTPGNNPYYTYNPGNAPYYQDNPPSPGYYVPGNVVYNPSNPATNGAPATVLGVTFPGGVGGPATPINGVAVYVPYSNTPATVTVPPGAYVTIDTKV